MRHKPCMIPEFEGTKCFRQLRSILRFDLPAGIAPSVTRTVTVVLVIIQSADVSYKICLMIPYYKELGHMEAINMSTMMCLVGHVKDHRGQWAIVDRSGKSARSNPAE